MSSFCPRGLVWQVSPGKSRLAKLRPASGRAVRGEPPAGGHGRHQHLRVLELQSACSLPDVEYWASDGTRSTVVPGWGFTQSASLRAGRRATHQVGRGAGKVGREQPTILSIRPHSQQFRIGRGGQGRVWLEGVSPTVCGRRVDRAGSDGRERASSVRRHRRGRDRNRYRAIC